VTESPFEDLEKEGESFVLEAYWRKEEMVEEALDRSLPPADAYPAPSTSDAVQRLCGREEAAGHPGDRPPRSGGSDREMFAGGRAIELIHAYPSSR